jgi:hypothetical protein
VVRGFRKVVEEGGGCPICLRDFQPPERAACLNNLDDSEKASAAVSMLTLVLCWTIMLDRLL